MILVCGGQSRTKDQDHDGKPIPIYPTVVGVLDEDDPHFRAKLDAMLPNVVEGFVVRLLDKDVLKLHDGNLIKKIRKRREE